MTETAETEEVMEESPSKDEALASKHGYIDLDKIEDEEVRQQVHDRLGGLYRSYKETNSALNEMQERYVGMERKLSKLEQAELKKAEENELATVRKGLAESQAKGDYESAAKFQERLVEIKQPKPVQQETRDEGLTQAQQSALYAWQAEMTDDGRILRPWANPGHPKYRETISELTKAYGDPSVASQGFDAVLETVHGKMTPKPKQQSPVADGDATPTRRTSKEVKLTPQEERTARRMYPTAVLEKLGEKDPLVAYAKAKKKYAVQGA